MPRAWWNLPTPVAAAVLTFALIAMVGQLRSAAPAVVPVATPSLPIIVIQREPAAVVPAQQVVYAPAAPVEQPRMVVAWAAPGGAVLGPVPIPDASAIRGRWNNDWVMIEWNGGPVWLRTADLGLNLANVEPQTAPVQSAPQPAYAPAQPVYQTDSAPPANEPPPQPVEQQPAAAAAPVPQAQPTEPPTSGIFYQQTPTQIELQRLAWAYEHCTDPYDPSTCIP
jgi:hypothetical protein